MKLATGGISLLSTTAIRTLNWLLLYWSWLGVCIHHSNSGIGKVAVSGKAKGWDIIQKLLVGLSKDDCELFERKAVLPS